MSRTSHSKESPREAFILLRPDPQSLTAATDRATKAIEAIGGRVVMGYPPGALVAEVPQSRMHELAGKGDIEAVQVDPFSEEQVNAEISDLRFLMIAWNNRCATRNRKDVTPRAGMSWDAPGMLPPDAPADVQREFRRREKEMKPDEPEE